MLGVEWQVGPARPEYSEHHHDHRYRSGDQQPYGTIHSHAECGEPDGHPLCPAFELAVGEVAVGSGDRDPRPGPTRLGSDQFVQRGSVSGSHESDRRVAH